ncbi:hypothetical protein FOXYSP1_05842 [Fusarium oxysporum f. sp. phaseoli]
MVKCSRSLIYRKFPSSAVSPHGVVVYHAALICPRLHGGMLRSRVQSSLGAPIYFFALFCLYQLRTKEVDRTFYAKS